MSFTSFTFGDFLLTITLLADHTLIPAMIVHMLGPQEYDWIRISTALIQLGFVIEPAILMIVLNMLRPSKYQRTGA